MINNSKCRQQGFVFKWLLIIILLGVILSAPTQFLHFMGVMLHTLYESFAFAIEKVLVHGFGLNKFQSQMIVFYSSLMVGVMLLNSWVRRIPILIELIKWQLLQGYAKACDQFIDTWIAISTRRKFELLVMQFAGFVSLLIYVLA